MFTGTNLFDALNHDGKKKYNQNDYAPFGTHSDYAYEQGWLPVVSSGGATTYKNRYAPAFSGVMINNKPQGELQIIGNKNGLFDVVVMNNKNGKVEHTIMKGQPYKAVDEYFRSNQNIINQRRNRLSQGQEGASIFSYRQ